MTPTNGNRALHISLPRVHGSVTERLSKRLDALEPVVQRMLANEAKLIADAVTAQERERRIAECLRGLGVDMERVERDALLALSWPSALTFWGRLRWLVTGA